MKNHMIIIEPCIKHMKINESWKMMCKMSEKQNGYESDFSLRVSVSRVYFSQELRRRRTMGKTNDVFESCFQKKNLNGDSVYATYYRNPTLGVYPHQSQTLVQPIIGKCREIICCSSLIRPKNVFCLYYSLLSERFSSRNRI